MHGDLRQQIYLNFSQRNTEELVEIWRAHDCNEWSGMTFDVIQAILQERYVELPPHRESINEPDRLNENPAKWLGERHDWVVIVGLCGSLLVFVGVATYRHEMMPWSSLLLVLLVGYWLAGIHYLITDTSAHQADKRARWQKPVGWFVLAASAILGGVLLIVFALVALVFHIYPSDLWRTADRGRDDSWSARLRPEEHRSERSQGATDVQSPPRTSRKPAHRHAHKGRH